jgi:hypothetical protein
MAKKKTEDIEDILDEIEEDEVEEEEFDEDEEPEEEYEDDEEEEDEDEDDLVEDDPDEKPKKRGRSAAKKSAVKEGVGTNEVAEAAGISPRSLRMLLRAEFDKPEDGWRWSSLSHPQVKKILKRIDSGKAKTEKQSKKLDKKKASKKTTKKTSKKTTKKGSRKKK